MIINYDVYRCNKCGKEHWFDTSKPYSKSCPVCGRELEFDYNVDGDTELAEKVKNAPPYNPTADPNSPLYIPRATCPYCHSRNTQKISTMSKVIYAEMVGIFAMDRMGKQWHCNKCHSDF